MQPLKLLAKAATPKWRFDFFDRGSPPDLPPDAICGFFGTKKGTVCARAAEIEKACRIHVGQEGLCSEEISDSLTFVQFSNGYVMTRQMAKEKGIIAG